MPTISMFYGILIQMNYNDHTPPHFHAKYQDDEASFSLDGEIIEGSMPAKQAKLIAAWAEIHREELEANWNLRKEGEPIFKIRPLE